MLNSAACVSKVKTDINKISARFTGMAFKWEINLANLAVAASTIVAVTLFVGNDHASIIHVNENMNDLKSTMNELKVDMSQQFKSVHVDIGNLPDIQAQAKQTDNRVGNLEHSQQTITNDINDIKVRLGTIEGIQLRGIRQPR